MPDRMLEGGSWHVGRRRIGREPFEGPPHTHDGFSEVMVCLGGRFENYVRDAWREMSPGDVVFIAPDDLHQVKGAGCEWVNVAFAAAWLDWADEALGVEGRLAGLTRRRHVPDYHLEARDLAVVDEELRACCACRQGRQSQPRFRLLLMGLLGRFLLSPTPAARATEPHWLSSLLTRFEALAPEDQTRQRLVALSGRSEEHLCRVLRQRLGQSPTEYINALRLDRAAELLRTTSRSVMKVALACGFGGVSYFHRRFRRRFGCSPGEFRRRHWHAL